MLLGTKRLSYVSGFPWSGKILTTLILTAFRKKPLGSNLGCLSGIEAQHSNLRVLRVPCKILLQAQRKT